MNDVIWDNSDSLWNRHIYTPCNCNDRPDVSVSSLQAPPHFSSAGRYGLVEDHVVLHYTAIWTLAM